MLVLALSFLVLSSPSSSSISLSFTFLLFSCCLLILSYSLYCKSRHLSHVPFFQPLLSVILSSPLLPLPFLSPAAPSLPCSSLLPCPLHDQCIQVFAALTLLRKICSHPDLLKFHFPERPADYGDPAKVNLYLLLSATSTLFSMPSFFAQHDDVLLLVLQFVRVFNILSPLFIAQVSHRWFLCCSHLNSQSTKMQLLSKILPLWKQQVTKGGNHGEGGRKGGKRREGRE